MPCPALTQPGTCLPLALPYTFPPLPPCCSHTSFLAVSQAHQASSHLKALPFLFLGAFLPDLGLVSFFKMSSFCLDISSIYEDSLRRIAPLLFCLSPFVEHLSQFAIILFLCLFLFLFLFPPLCKVHKSTVPQYGNTL